MQMVRSSESSALSPADALMVDHYRSKQHWVEFINALSTTHRKGWIWSNAQRPWSRVNKLFRNL